MIPTNLITGFLGVGKTTAVIDLLRRKPPGARWAVLVNEYGQVSLDDAILAAEAPEGVTIREVAGGCICCASAPYLPVALHFLLQDARPHRLLIETSGLGHPARLIDTLRTRYAGRLDLRAVVGLVDPADFAEPRQRANPVFIDQVHLADVLVLNKREQASAELLAEFQAWANALYPPKLLIAATTQGRLDPAWLDLSARDERHPQFPLAHATPESNGHPEEIQAGEPERPRPGRPVRYQTSDACGWVFTPQDVFDRYRLLRLLASLSEVHRLKGIFQVENDWLLVQRVRGELQTAPIAYRRDSRLQVFGLADPAGFEQALLACLRNQGAGEASDVTRPA